MNRKSLSALFAIILLSGCNYNDYKGVDEPREQHCPPGSPWRGSTYSVAFMQRTIPDVMITDGSGMTGKYTPAVRVRDIACACANDNPNIIVFTVKASISHGAKGVIPPQTLAVPFFVQANDRNGDNVFERKMFDLKFDLSKQAPEEQTFVITYDVTSLKQRNISNFTFWSGLYYTSCDLSREYNDRSREIGELINAKVDSCVTNVVAK